MAVAFNYSSTAVETTLTGDIDAVATTMSVGATTGFPAVPFKLTIAPDTPSEEIVKVTNVAGLSLTIEREWDGTVGLSHSTGDQVKHQATAEDLRLSRQHEDGTANVHGVGATSDVVGTLTVQTLEGKTIDGADNTVQNIDPTASITAYVDNLKEMNETVITGLGFQTDLAHQPRGGVLGAPPDVFPSDGTSAPTPNSSLLVTLSGTAIHCTAGRAIVPSFFGSRIAKRGASGDTGLVVSAPHATLDRWDIVSITLSESAFGAPASTITYTEGTPSATPSEPAVPADSLILARIEVTNSGAGGAMTLRERRVRAVANGGVLPVLNDTERDALTPHEGDVIWHSTDALQAYNGSAWVQIGVALDASVTSFLVNGIGANWSSALQTNLDSDTSAVLAAGGMGTGWPDVLAEGLGTAAGLRPVAYSDATSISPGSSYSANSPVCGGTFVVPPSGQVVITVSGQMRSAQNQQATLLSFEVREGGSLGAGSVALAASDSWSVETSAAVNTGAPAYTAGSRRKLVTGLTPGATYNTRAMTRSFLAASGTVYFRELLIEPVL